MRIKAAITKLTRIYWRIERRQYVKTRAEIYGKEAADLLRNITTYHYIRRDQCLQLYPARKTK